MDGGTVSRLTIPACTSGAPGARKLERGFRFPDAIAHARAPAAPPARRTSQGTPQRHRWARRGGLKKWGTPNQIHEHTVGGQNPAPPFQHWVARPRAPFLILGAENTQKEKKLNGRNPAPPLQPIKATLNMGSGGSFYTLV